MRDYLEQQGAGYRTCAVIYDINKKKAEKKWLKLYSKYTRKPKAQRLKSGEKPKDLPTPWLVKTIEKEDFHFVGIAPTSFEEPKTNAELKKAKAEAKLEKKMQKKMQKEKK